MGDQRVAFPHLVKVTVWSSGRADISSAAFDGNRNFELDLQVPILEINRPATDTSLDSLNLEVSDHSKIILRPSLIRRGASGTLQVVVDGVPSVHWFSPLPDIKVSEETASDTRRIIEATRKKRWVTPVNVGWLVFALSMLSLIIGLCVNLTDKDAGQAWGVPGLMFLMLSAAFLLVAYVVIVIRWAVHRTGPDRSAIQQGSRGPVI
ncbi:hypothetical protein [Agreia bicolorata]|uniref:Uncharacterized protein n=1 Tax=Agreia bicolorata TaxID=110935 RepID=A0ABR5CB86_9MICO|nr:hypothetical protein [Agreia bicolorata]KJC62899.1 hypothetical protein TZ00_17965 [Agreia bicolorata]